MSGPPAVLCVSGQEEGRERQRHRAQDGFVVWLSFETLPEPRWFRCPAHVCVRAWSGRATDALIDERG